MLISKQYSPARILYTSPNFSGNKSIVTYYIKSIKKTWLLFCMFLAINRGNSPGTVREKIGNLPGKMFLSYIILPYNFVRLSFWYSRKFCPNVYYSRFFFPIKLKTTGHISDLPIFKSNFEPVYIKSPIFSIFHNFVGRISKNKEWKVTKCVYNVRGTI